MSIKEQHVLEGRKSNSREKEIKNSKLHNVWRHWKEKYQMTCWFTTHCRRKANDEKHQGDRIPLLSQLFQDALVVIEQLL